MILVSACFLGDKCKYTGGDNKDERIIALLKHIPVVSVCPEMLGGLGVPREPMEISHGTGNDVIQGTARVVTNQGCDVTNQILAGAQKTKEIAQQHGIRMAIMKERSPSCGVRQIHTGNFDGTTREGAGVTTALLLTLGINVVSEEKSVSELDRLIRGVYRL